MVGENKMFDELSKKIVNCKKCELHKTRHFAVVGEGDLKANLMFIGEAPGQEEDQTGLPFIGAAGQVLNELFAHLGMDRRKIFIANVLKCRPPKNANPTPEQIACCSEYLFSQLDIVHPLVICPLGNFAVDFVFKRYGLEKEIQGITKIKGKVFKVNKPNESVRYIIPLLHPAVATYNPTRIDELKRDIEVLLTLEQYLGAFND